MARPLRIDLKGGWYHVTARGHNRQTIYLDQRDRGHFLELLGEMVQRHAVELHAFVLMPNHYHLLVHTPHANLSAAIQWLNVAYSIWWNRRHNRTGSLFQGRFKAIVVQSGNWVLECSLYIHLNPVAIASLQQSKQEKAAERRGWRKADRATLEQRLERLRSYVWSSFRAYAGYGPKVSWLTQEAILERAGGRAGYRKLAEQRAGRGLEESLWNRLRWGVVLGGEGFARQLREQFKVNRETSGGRAIAARCSWPEVVRALEQVRGEKWNEFAGRYGDPGLALALYMARRCTGLTLREMANSYDFGKFFAEIGEHAFQWGTKLEGAGNFRVIEAQFPTSTANQFMRWPSLDNIGPARLGTFEQLGKPTIRLWPESP